jgi:peptide/nickel transport system substrate-binding protein
LESYSPESRTIIVKTFDDESYPFKIGKWSEFENVQFPIIKKIDMVKIIQYGESADILIETENTDSVLYFLMDSKGDIQASEKLNVKENKVTIKITSKITEKLQQGANSIKVFAISNSVLKPDFYESSFLITKNNVELPSAMINTSNIENEINHNTWVIPIMLIIVVIVVITYAKIKVNRNRQE